MPFFEEYRPLDDPKTSIRILEVLPGRYPEPVYAVLKHADLSANLKYFTVSYRWSVFGADKLIWVDNRPCAISRDVWSMLHHLRKSNIAIIVWIDVLCIDQRNPSEKGHQVQLMGSIYNKAVETVIWLGEESDEIRSAFLYFVGWNSTTGSELDEVKLAAIRALCQREYWNRAWIRQEILNSNAITIRCGDMTISWNEFVECCQQPSLKSSLGQTGAFVFLDHSIPINGKSTVRKRITLQLLVEQYGMSACLEVRDRIYALFSLASDYGRDLNALSADYTISVDRLLQNVIRYCQPKDIGAFRSHLRKVLEIDLEPLITPTMRIIHTFPRELEFSYLGTLGSLETISESSLEFYVFHLVSHISQHRVRGRILSEAYQRNFIDFRRMIDHPNVKHKSIPGASSQTEAPLAGDMVYQIHGGSYCALLLRPSVQYPPPSQKEENFRLKPPSFFYARFVLGQGTRAGSQTLLRISPQTSWLATNPVSLQTDSLTIPGITLAKILCNDNGPEAARSLLADISEKDWILKNAVPDLKKRLHLYDGHELFRDPRTLKGIKDETVRMAPRKSATPELIELGNKMSANTRRTRKLRARARNATG